MSFLRKQVLADWGIRVEPDDDEESDKITLEVRKRLQAIRGQG